MISWPLLKPCVDGLIHEGICPADMLQPYRQYGLDDESDETHVLFP